MRLPNIAVALPRLLAPTGTAAPTRTRRSRRVADVARGALTPDAVRPMTADHARAAAELHRRYIRTGFLSKLGGGFLRHLYAAIASSPSGFGFVCEDDNGEVLGFVACAENTGKLYRQSLLRRGLFMAFAIIRYLVRPSCIKRMLETLRYPAEVGSDLPQAEVLSVSVARRARGRGIGKLLLKTALAEFARRGIDRAKVAVSADNSGARAFYKCCGFRLVLTREHHGLPMNVYAIGDLTGRLARREAPVIPATWADAPEADRAIARDVA